MGCAPSKGNTIAVQPAVTPRAHPGAATTTPHAHPPITPPLAIHARGKGSNPLDERRPLPAIGGGGGDHVAPLAPLTTRKSSNLTTVPEQDEATQPNRILPKLDVNAMASDAKESESSKDVKQTQSSVAFTFDFGDSADVKPVGRLPPLIREKTMRKSTDADDLQSSIKKKQQLADDRRQNELNSIAGKKKRRKLKLKSSKLSEDSSSDAGGQRSEVVPPLDISRSPDKNGSPSSEVAAPNNRSLISTSTPVRVLSEEQGEGRDEIERRKGSAHHDSTYGSEDENENQSRVVDPLRRFSRNKKTAHQHQERDAFYSDENVNPMEAAQFFDDDSEQF
ncbi:uncharacterized protein LOC134842922 [Symsagittifera roscoffensis]|uniref:uncharacterized protein LOC134842922 n=1 Tax=Symsagittifera roscoffensis TaxID=84072 RepID=UPI00307C8292